MPTKPEKPDIDRDELIEVATKCSVAFRVLQSAIEDMKWKTPSSNSPSASFRKGAIMVLAQQADRIALDLGGLTDRLRELARIT